TNSTTSAANDPSPQPPAVSAVSDSDLPLAAKNENSQANGLNSPQVPRDTNDSRMEEDGSDAVAADRVPPADQTAVSAADVTANVSTPSNAPSVDANLPAISIVDFGGRTAFASLELACREAKDGAIIELRYNGSRSPIEQALQLTNKHLTI